MKWLATIYGQFKQQFLKKCAMQNAEENVLLYKYWELLIRLSLSFHDFLYDRQPKFLSRLYPKKYNKHFFVAK